MALHEGLAGNRTAYLSPLCVYASPHNNNSYNAFQVLQLCNTKHANHKYNKPVCNAHIIKLLLHVEILGRWDHVQHILSVIITKLIWYCLFAEGVGNRDSKVIELCNICHSLILPTLITVIRIDTFISLFKIPNNCDTHWLIHNVIYRLVIFVMFSGT